MDTVNGDRGAPPLRRGAPPIGVSEILWVTMMLVWLAGLCHGLWWVWPHFERMTPSADLVMASVWLITGAAAWLVALNLGLRRYWPRKP